MIDLSKNDPPLDLKFRIDQYRIENSPAIFTEPEFLIVSGALRRNKPLRNYVGDDPFETQLVRLMIAMSQDLSNLLSGFYAGYTASNKFVLVYHPKYFQTPINRDNLISLICSRSVNFASQYYQNPMCLISAYQVPKVEVQNILAYYKMSWIARRNRLLGQQVLGLSPDDTSLTHDEVLKAVEANGYSLLNLSSSLRDGFFFSPY